MSEAPDEIPGLARDLRRVIPGNSPDHEGKLMTTTRGKGLAGLVLTSLCASATVPTAAWATAPVLVIGPRKPRAKHRPTGRANAV